jgi:subtilisin family serine protease
MPVDVLFDANHPLGGCSGSTLDLANGIIWAADHGADVMNISLQFYSLSTGDANLLHNAIRYAHDLDIVIVAATGNNQGALVAYPALFPETVAVGGTTCQNRHARAGISANWTSNSGPEIDVAAPGDQIWSCDENDGYQEISGTSMATPHVSGLAALIRSVDPLLTNADVEQVLRDSTVDVESAGWDELTGHGVVNAYAAMVAVADITPAIPAVSTWGLLTLALLGMIAGTCILLDPRAGHSKESAVD